MTTRESLSSPTAPEDPRVVATWRKRWLRIVVAAGVAALSGVLVAALTPRGPVTSGQALGLLATGLATGVLAGAINRSRWIYLLAPLVQLAAFELGRWGAVGPTVDGLRLDTAFGVLAFVLGRGVYALLGLLPLVLGVLYGRALTRRLTAEAHPVGGRRRVRQAAGRTLTALLTAGLVVLAVFIARPAHTPPILGPDGELLPGSVAALEPVRLGGSEQWIMLRGADVNKPVLLYLSGGPGQSDLPYTRVLLGDLERDFVVVAWDQRGTGKSYEALEPTATLTLEGAVSDTAELTNYLRKRFDEEKIYLLGESWGSTLAVLAAQAHPELYHAVIGSGQMVSQRVTDQRIWRDLLAYADRTGDGALYDRVLSLGEPPYRDVPWANAFVMGHYDALTAPYTPPAAYIERGTAANLGFYGVFGSEYTLIEKINVLRGLIDMFSVMYPQLQELDFRRDVPRLGVPIYLLDGKAELSARRELALEWFAGLEAPRKRLYSFDDAAHSVAFEQFGAVQTLMTDTVVPETYRAEPGSRR